MRAAVLVNDFGSINIDAKLVIGVEGDTVSLANGCVCCSIRGELIPACVALMQRDDPPELLIVETSGVSEPFQVANTFMLPEIERVILLDSVLTVVDAENFPELLSGERAALSRTQVQDADMVVLSKTDLVDKNRLAAVRELVHRIAPRARILDANSEGISLNAILRSSVRETDARFKVTQIDHARQVLDRSFATWHWACDQPLSLPKLRRVVEALPKSIYRAKGIVYLEELPSYQFVLQMVGKRYDIGDTEPWGTQAPKSEIVMIGSPGGIDSDALRDAFDDCIGTGDETQSPILALKRFLDREERRPIWKN